LKNPLPFIKKHAAQALLVTAGLILCALAVNAFYVPLQLTLGGVSGVATIIYQLSGRTIPLGMLIMLLNVPVFIIGWKSMGRKFILRSLAGTIGSSVAIDLLAPAFAAFSQKYLMTTLTSGAQPDPLVFCVFAALAYGVGLGLLLRAGFTTGGVDILAFVLKRRWKNLRIAQTILLMDVAVLAASAIAYRNSGTPSVLLALYSGVSVYLTSLVVDFVVAGYDNTKLAVVITTEPQAVGSAVMTKLGRGVTSLEGRGMYTGGGRAVLLVALARTQVATLKTLVSQQDPAAFVVVTDAQEVQGEGFRERL